MWNVDCGIWGVWFEYRFTNIKPRLFFPSPAIPALIGRWMYKARLSLVDVAKARISLVDVAKARISLVDVAKARLSLVDESRSYDVHRVHRAVPCVHHSRRRPGGLRFRIESSGCRV
jgi:hypothetical protein